MKEKLELLESVIYDLQNLYEKEYDGYTSESISGGGGNYTSSYMAYFDKEDRDRMVKKLKDVYDYLDDIKTIRKIKLEKINNEE